RLRGANAFGCERSNVNRPPRLWRAKPAPPGTTPEPKLAKLLWMSETILPAASAAQRYVVSPPCMGRLPAGTSLAARRGSIGAAAGDRPQRPRQVRIAEDFAGFRRPVIRQVDRAGAGVAAQQRGAAAPFERGNFRDRKAVLGVRHRRGQNRLERGRPEFLVQ